MVNVFSAPSHPAAVGTTDTIPCAMTLPVLRAVNVAIVDPLPLAASPIVLLSLSQANVLPATLLKKLIAVV